MSLEIPNRYLALAPIIVTSPTARCGTTLIQRLLSASTNCFIYGENVGHHIRTLTGFLTLVIRQFEEWGRGCDEDFKKALAGAQVDWRPGLMPPTSVMLRAWVDTYYQIPMALAEFGLTIDRPIWGFKGPAYPRELLNALLMLMPRSKVVYVFRDLFEALKSAKARRFVVSDEDVTAFCATWAANMSAALEMRQDARLMFVRYEYLIAHPAEHARLLEVFTGAKNLQEQVFDLKINTFLGDERDGYSSSQYIAPTELTAADRAAVISSAGAVMSQLYGVSPEGVAGLM